MSCSSSPLIAVRSPRPVLPVPSLLSKSMSCSSSPLIAVYNPCPVLPVPSLLSKSMSCSFSRHCCPNPCPVPSAGIAVHNPCPVLSAGIAVQIHVLFFQPALLSTIQAALMSTVYALFPPPIDDCPESMSCCFSQHYCPRPMSCCFSQHCCPQPMSCSFSQHCCPQFTSFFQPALLSTIDVVPSASIAVHNSRRSFSQHCCPQFTSFFQLALLSTIHILFFQPALLSTIHIPPPPPFHGRLSQSMLHFVAVPLD